MPIERRLAACLLRFSGKPERDSVAVNVWTLGCTRRIIMNCYCV